MFKKDDKVVIISTPFESEYLQPGQTGVVDGVLGYSGECGQLISVTMDNGHSSELHGFWCFYASELALIEGEQDA